MTYTTCPLDCFDSCSIVYNNGKLEGNPKHPFTQGSLCRHMYKFKNFPILQKARYKGKEIGFEEALERLHAFVEEEVPSKTLFYKGSGNLGMMQSITKAVFANLGATVCHSNLCDPIGEHAIVQGRGENLSVDEDELAKSDVVIIWGRNPKHTNSHVLPFFKGKTLVVIDPYAISLTKKAGLHLQLKPKSDYYLALLLTQITLERGLEATSFLQKHTKDFEAFKALSKSYSKEFLLEACGLSQQEVEACISTITGKKVFVLLGLGAQKYYYGAEAFRAIDGFCAVNDFFSREGCGVNYLGSSGLYFDMPFSASAQKSMHVVNVAFKEFNTVVVQGGNPLSQMPNTNRVKKELALVNNLVYFGLYENELSQMSDLVIPAKTFLEKEDFKTSYGHNYAAHMPCIEENASALSEYEVASFMAKKYHLECKPESEYIQAFIQQCNANEGYYQAKKKITRPYAKGFYTEDKRFHFLTQAVNISQEKKGFYLLTSKSASALNSQFNTDHNLYVNPEVGFKEGEMVEVSNAMGTICVCVKHDKNLRKDCVLMYSGNKYVNHVTSDKLSKDAVGPIYQELQVEIKKC